MDDIDRMIVAAIQEEQQATCLRIEKLASGLDIKLRFIGAAGPEYETPNALLVEFDHPDAGGLMKLQEVTYLGPFEFGCDWQWTGPTPALWYYPVERRLAGRPKKYRRAIPISDLDTLLTCLDVATQVSAGDLPSCWSIDVRRRGFGLVEGWSVLALPGKSPDPAPPVQLPHHSWFVTRSRAQRKLTAWIWEEEMDQHWESMRVVAEAIAGRNEQRG